MISVDFITRKERAEKALKFDCVALISLCAGLATPLFILHGPMELTPNPWWYPWLLPSYVVGFLVALTSRFAQRAFQRTAGPAIL